MNPETAAEADLLDQLRDLHPDDEPEPTPVVDVEADPADVTDQNRPVPAEEDDWPGA